MKTKKHLLCFDFDGTIITSDAAPSGVTVESAYRSAVLITFGTNGLIAYELTGHIGSRGPGEIVTDILDFAQLNNMTVKNMLKDPSILTNQFSHIILEIILPEISPEWPCTFDGFAEIRQKALSLPVVCAIVSNSHKDIISRVFEVNRMELPEIIVATERLQEEQSLHRVKPDPFSLELAKQDSIGRYGNLVSAIMIGDNDKKDGGMSRAAGIPFGHFTPSSTFGLEIFHVCREIRFKDYARLNEVLFAQEEIYWSGNGFHEVFLRSYK